MLELKKRNLSQILYCPRGSELAQKLKDEQLPATELAKGPLWSLAWALKLKHATESDSETILHAHDGKAHNIALFLALINPHIRIVVHRRIIKTQNNPYYRWKYNHPSIRKIICISQAVYKSVAPIVHNPDRLILIPSGIKIQASSFTEPKKELVKSELGLPNKSQVVINIGSLLPQKNQIQFLEMAKLYLQRNPEKKGSTFFLILGEGPERARLERFIKDQALEESCRLLGYTQKAQEVLASADIFVSTAVDEALGNVILESFMARVPVVASRSGGFIDLIENEKTGFLVDLNNSRAFAQACEFLFQNPSRAQSLCDLAYRQLQDFDLEKTSESVYKIYQSILSENEGENT